MVKANLKGYRQGELDCLCGVYSIINACEAICGQQLKKNVRKRLFQKLMQTLEEEYGACLALTSGIPTKKLRKLIPTACYEMLDRQQNYITFKRPWKSNDVDFDDFWSVICSHVQKENKVAIVGLENTHDHWTVVANATEKTLKLIDSGGVKDLKKAYCNNVKTEKTKHVLKPKQVILLSAKNMSEEILALPSRPR